MELSFKVGETDKKDVLNIYHSSLLNSLKNSFLYVDEPLYLEFLLPEAEVSPP